MSFWIRDWIRRTLLKWFKLLYNCISVSGMAIFTLFWSLKQDDKSPDSCVLSGTGLCVWMAPAVILAAPRLDCAASIIAGLPPTGSWQDLKDHMREAGDICYADVFHDGTGVVEFVRYEDMKYAVKKLDDTKFRSHEVSHQITTPV